VLLRLGLNELAKVCKLICIPVYYSQIFQTHYFQLNELAGVNAFQITCGALKEDLYSLWGQLELVVFYAYLASCVLFIMTASFFKINKWY
jgi:hypothetical protein